MRVEITEVVRIEEHQTLSLAELADLSRLSEADLLELLECGVIAPIGSAADRPSFGAECLIAARAASRLKEELDLDAHSVAVVLALLERIRRLESQLRGVEARGQT
jgi:chaperone modulatory protein CbpM